MARREVLEDCREEGMYLVIVGAHPYYDESSGLWYANKTHVKLGRAGNYVFLCPSLFEAACPGLKLRPGQTVEIEVTKKEKSDG